MMRTWILVAAVVSLVGCNTMAGVGKDVEKAGSAIENAAKKK
jgi:predicted small secreted protein